MGPAEEPRSVDDVGVPGHTDGTRDVLQSRHGVTVIFHERNAGKGAATISASTSAAAIRRKTSAMVCTSLGTIRRTERGTSESSTKAATTHH
jgi:hypothetical protein